MRQSDVREQCRREDERAYEIGVECAVHDLILWLRGLRRRGLDADEYEWVLDRLCEIRRDVERLAGNDYQSREESELHGHQ